MHACVSRSSGGCSSSVFASSCSRLTPASTLRGGRAPPTECREVVCEDELRVSGRTLAPPVLVRCLWHRDDHGRSRAARTVPSSVVQFANRPAAEIGDVVYGEDELLRGDPAPAGAAPEAAVGPLARRRPARPRRARALDARHRRHARARARLRPHAGVAAAPSAVLQARTTSSSSPARRRWARPRSPGCSAWRCSREGWEVHECTRPEQVEERFDRSSARSCSSPTTRSARPSTGRTPPSAGRTTSTASCAPPTSTTGSSGPRGPRRCAPACGGCTASAAASASRSPPRCRSTPPRSASEEKTLILFRHARAADLLARAARARPPSTATRSSTHPHFTPERIRRFVAARRRRVDATSSASCASRPTAMADLLRRARARAPRAAAARCSTRRPARSPSATSRRRCAATRRSGLPKAPADLVDRLADHFLRVIA